MFWFQASPLIDRLVPNGEYWPALLGSGTIQDLIAANIPVAAAILFGPDGKRVTSTRSGNTEASVLKYPSLGGVKCVALVDIPTKIV